MSLKTRAAHYYFDLDKSCGEAILLAAGEEYGFPVTAAEAQLFAGFRTGMGCGATCGALSGAMGVLSRKYAGREDLKELCARFVAEFEAAMGCNALDCATLAAQYKTDAARCTAAVERCAQALADFIDGLEGKSAPAEGCTLSPDDIKRVKGMGFLHHKGTNRFNARVITRNGRITAAECAAIAAAAEQYGDGHMMFTTRLTVEVSGVEYHNIPAFQAELAKAGLETGGTGSKVRPVVSCKGTTCQYGLYDTYDLSRKIHERFYKGYHDVSLPHKFKIALGGCPNNCVKPNLNDLGIIGAKVPQYNAQLCRGCAKCQMEAACPIKIARMENGKLAIDWEACNSCGRCVGKCPFHCADQAVYGWKVYVGGRWGKKVTHGRMLDKLFTSEEEVLDVVEKTILLFRDQGIPGERLADTIERIGFDRAQQLLLGDELLARKAEILGLNVVGGATC